METTGSATHWHRHRSLPACLPHRRRRRTAAAAAAAAAASGTPVAPL